VYKWPDGDIFEGEFSDGKRSGAGMLKRKNGDVYEQVWREERFDEFSKGIETSPDVVSTKIASASGKLEDSENLAGKAECEDHITDKLTQLSTDQDLKDKKRRQDGNMKSSDGESDDMEEWKAEEEDDIMENGDEQVTEEQMSPSISTSSDVPPPKRTKQ